MYNYHNNHKKHNNHNNQKHFAPRNDYSGAAISAINRAYREVNGFNSYDVRDMISYVNSHRFYQSPAPSIHGVIDTYKKTNGFNSYDVRDQIWKSLRKYSR